MSGQPESSRETEQSAKDMDMRLSEFVDDFVSIYEAYFSEYYKRLKEQIPKSGKWADLANEVLEIGKGGAESIEEAEIKSIFFVVVSIIQRAVSIGGAKYNREQLKILTQKLYEFKNHPSEVRKMLIESSIDVFRSFESQFMQVTSSDDSKSWKRAMEKIAQDAANRVISYYKKNPEKQVSFSTITQGIILGKSKRYKSSIVPNFYKGHSLSAERFNNKDFKLTTEKLFEEPGLAIIDSGDYYEKSSSSDKYGFRLLFKWEDSDKEIKKGVLTFKNENRRYTKLERTPSNKYKYLLTEEKLKEKQIEILVKLDDQVQALTQERLAGILQEVKVDAEENAKKLLKNMEGNLSGIKEFLDEIKQELDKMKQINEKNLEISKKTLENSEKALENSKEALEVAKQESKQVRRPIWFEMKKSVKSFSGRQKQLDQIDSLIKHKIIVITGLRGVGKSELAIKFAHVHGEDYNKNAVWINSETRETAKASFRNLHKMLKLKISDEDGEEKGIELLVDDIYKHLNDQKILFIFDNAEKFSTIQKFLPLGLPDDANNPHVLITSPNKLDWKSTRINIEILSLSDFTNKEAEEYVKTVLKIGDDSQNGDITNLVKRLHNFPLALQHAVTYISDRSEDFQARGSEFKVRDYLEKYEQEPKEMLSIKLRDDEHTEATFTVLKITIDKIKDNKEYGKKALDMLNIVSYFMSRNIPEKIFLNELAGGDQDKLISITRLLWKYSIVNLENDMLNVHGLVQKIRRLELSNPQEGGKSLEEKLLRRALVLLKKYVKASPGNAASCIPHIISIWDYASKYDELIQSFIVDSTNNKATTSTTYINLIIEGSNYDVINTLITKINRDKRKEVINRKSKDYVTPLHKAVLRNDEEIVKLVIDGGADVNAKKRNGWTPLHLAVKNGHVETIRVLLEKNPDLNAKTGYKFTSLHLAAQNGYSEIVKLLLHDDNINVNAETEYNFTPVHFAAKKGYINIVKALLEKGVNVNIKDTGSFTPLHSAAGNNHIEVVNDLLQISDIDVNAQTTKGNTPLHLAAEKGNLEVVKALIARNAHVDVKNKEGKAASDLAQDNNHLAVRNYIIQYRDKKEVLNNQVEQPKFNKT